MSGDIPAVARNNLLAWKPLSESAAIFPVSERVGALNSPPVTMRVIPGFSPNINAMFSALVMTVSSLYCVSSLAISVVVEPESRMMHSPSRINDTAFRAISLFSSIWFWLKTFPVFANEPTSFRKAPPCSLWIYPNFSRAYKSCLIVTSVTLKILLNS